MSYRTKIAALVVAIAFVGAACGSDDDNTEDAASTPTTAVSQSAAALGDLADAIRSSGNGVQPAAGSAADGTAPATDAPAPAASAAQPAAAGSPAECVSTTEMNSLVKSDVQRVGGEACAYTLRVAALGATGVVCANGLICTLSFSDGVRVYKGDGSSFQGVIAGTVRHVASYPSGDAVHAPCALTGKEDRFGKAQRPPFPVTPGNFSC